MEGEGLFNSWTVHQIKDGTKELCEGQGGCPGLPLS